MDCSTKEATSFFVAAGLIGMSKKELQKEGIYRSIITRQEDGNNEQKLIRRGAEEGIFSLG